MYIACHMVDAMERIPIAVANNWHVMQARSHAGMHSGVVSLKFFVPPQMLSCPQKNFKHQMKAKIYPCNDVFFPKLLETCLRS